MDECNKESGLHMQPVTDEPDAFSSMLAHYGAFRNVRNYIVLAGRKSPDFDEKYGCYGEKTVLYAATLGLDSCWVSASCSRKKTKFTLENGETLNLVIALGYGADKGKAHKSKPRDAVIRCEDNPPSWFTDGAEAALPAPTAMNQQKFRFVPEDNGRVRAQAGTGFYTKVDLENREVPL